MVSVHADVLTAYAIPPKYKCLLGGAVLKGKDKSSKPAKRKTVGKTEYL